MRFVGEIKDGVFILSDSQLQARKNYLSKQKDGASVSEELKVVRKPKTQQQLGAFFGLAIKTIKMEFDDRGIDTSYLLPQAEVPTGIPVSEGLLKEYLYAVCAVFDDDGKRLTLSGMSTKTAAEFFDNVQNFAASNWSICIPEPSPDWKTKQ